MPRVPQRKKQQEEINFVGHYAGFVTRLAAFILDALIVTMSVSVLWGIVAIILRFFNLDLYSLFSLIASKSNVLFLVTLLVTSLGSTYAVAFFYNVLFWMFAGKTIGKAVMGIRVVGPRGSRVTFWRGFRRFLGYWVSALPLFLGYLWVLVTDERVAWHDIFGGTRVIYDYEAKYSEALLGRLARLTPKLEMKLGVQKDQNNES